MTQDTPSSSEVSCDRRPIVVLLVDDQRFVGLAVERLLAGESDIELHCCGDASRAVMRANEVAPAIILLDFVMPGIDGLTLAGLFRQNPATARTPIIMLSGNDDAGSRARALAAGASDFLLKLPRKEDLIACLRTHLSCHATHDALPGRPPVREHGQQLDQILDLDVIALYCEPTPGGTLSNFGRTLIATFIREAESQLATLKDAMHCENEQLVRMAAHSLKGMSLTLGAQRLGELCRQLEGDVDGHHRELVAPDRIRAIDEAFVMVRKALSQL